jgi:hypothetical protein
MRAGPKKEWEGGGRVHISLVDVKGSIAVRVIKRNYKFVPGVCAIWHDCAKIRVHFVFFLSPSPLFPLVPFPFSPSSPLLPIRSLILLHTIVISAISNYVNSSIRVEIGFYHGIIRGVSEFCVPRLRARIRTFYLK